MTVKLHREGECGEVYWYEVHCDEGGCDNVHKSYTESETQARKAARESNGWESATYKVDMPPKGSHYPRHDEWRLWEVWVDYCPLHIKGPPFQTLRFDG